MVIFLAIIFYDTFFYDNSLMIAGSGIAIKRCPIFVRLYIYSVLFILLIYIARPFLGEFYASWLVFCAFPCNGKAVFVTQVDQIHLTQAVLELMA